jgi:rare lipoprotein A
MIQKALTALACVACFAATGASVDAATRFSGEASYYDEGRGAPVASGKRYDPKHFTCAHRTLPFGTRLRVTDRQTRRSVVVTVNDRGPFAKDRVLDLSLAAAKALRMIDRGVITVTATVAARSNQRR